MRPRSAPGQSPFSRISSASAWTPSRSSFLRAWKGLGRTFLTGTTIFMGSPCEPSLRISPGSAGSIRLGPRLSKVLRRLLFRFDHERGELPSAHRRELDAFPPVLQRLGEAPEAEVGAAALVE